MIEHHATHVALDQRAIVERAQEVLYHLYSLFLEKRIPHMKVFLDSPMAVKVTEVFKDHPELFDHETVKLLNN